MLNRIPSDAHGIPDAIARLRGKDRHSGAFTDDAQLIDGIGSLEVSGHEKWCVGLLSQVSRQLARKGRLPCSLEPGKHNHGGWMLGVPQAPRLSAEDSHKLFVDDLDDLLRWIQRPRDL